MWLSDSKGLHADSVSVCVWNIAVKPQDLRWWQEFCITTLIGRQRVIEVRRSSTPSTFLYIYVHLLLEMFQLPFLKSITKKTNRKQNQNQSYHSSLRWWRENSENKMFLRKKWEEAVEKDGPQGGALYFRLWCLRWASCMLRCPVSSPVSVSVCHQQ